MSGIPSVQPHHNLLERLLFSKNRPSLNSNQQAMDENYFGFIRSASDPKLMVGLMLSGLAYQAGQVAAYRILGNLGRIPFLSSMLAKGTGLAFETTVLRSSQALLNHQDLSHAFETKAFASTALDLGLLKGVSVFTQGQNVILAHAAQSASMVGGHELGARLGIVNVQAGTWVQKFSQAESFNIAMQGSQSLSHVAIGGSLGLRTALAEITVRSYETNVFLTEQSPFFVTMAGNGGKSDRPDIPIPRDPRNAAGSMGAVSGSRSGGGGEVVEPERIQVGANAQLQSIHALIYRYPDGRIVLGADPSNPPNSNVVFTVGGGVMPRRINLDPGERQELSLPGNLQLRYAHGYERVPRGGGNETLFHTRPLRQVELDAGIVCHLTEDSYGNRFFELRSSRANDSIPLATDRTTSTIVHVNAGEPFLIDSSIPYMIRLSNQWKSIAEVFPEFSSQKSVPKAAPVATVVTPRTLSGLEKTSDDVVVGQGLVCHRATDGRKNFLVLTNTGHASATSVRVDEGGSFVDLTLGIPLEINSSKNYKVRTNKGWVPLSKLFQ